MTIEVLDAGVQATVQDLGRAGYRAIGVPIAGALDPLAARLANAWLGNAEHAALIECAYGGLRLRVHQALRIAHCGGGTLYRNAVAQPPWSAFQVDRGDELRLKDDPSHGARAYLAVAGGLDVPSILGSRATDLNHGFGGLQGRALQRGDCLSVLSEDNNLGFFSNGAWLDPSDWYQDPCHHPIRLLPGFEWNQWSSKRQQQFLANEFQIMPSSNRMGLRLKGPGLATPFPEMISTPVLPGLIQLPPDGQPIVLLQDAQTIGGYPRLGVVIRADWPRLAQARIGARLRFALSTTEAAQNEFKRMQHHLTRMRLAMAQRVALNKRSFM